MLLMSKSYIVLTEIVQPNTWLLGECGLEVETDTAPECELLLSFEIYF